MENKMLKTINGGKAPTKGSKYSACIDLFSAADVVIGAGETAIVPLGVCIDIDVLKKILLRNSDASILKSPIEHQNKMLNNWLMAHYLALHPRSSLRAKGLIANVGVIDLDYRDEIKMIVHNPVSKTNKIKTHKGCQGYDSLPDVADSFTVEFSEDYTIKKGDKVAQIMLVEHKSYLLGVESDEERTGGFGSSGAR